MKTKTTHTPGPWNLCSDSMYSSKCLRGVQHSKKAAIHSSAEGRPTVASHVANWSDATLITAAPELLRHAAIAAEILRGLTIDAADREVLKNLDHAIAKANGEVH